MMESCCSSAVLALFRSDNSKTVKRKQIKEGGWGPTLGHGWGGLGQPHDRVALLFPANAFHLKACSTAIASVAETLSRLRVSHTVHYVTAATAGGQPPAGLLVDILIHSGWLENAVTQLEESKADHQAVVLASSKVQPPPHPQRRAPSRPVALRFLTDSDYLGRSQAQEHTRQGADSVSARSGAPNQIYLSDLVATAKLNISQLRKRAWEVRFVECSEWVAIDSLEEQECYILQILLQQW